MRTRPSIDPALQAQLAAVIRAFPWNNGITLLQGNMTPQLVEWSESDSSKVPGFYSSLVVVCDPFPSFAGADPSSQAQAETLDVLTFDNSVLDPRMQEFLRRLRTMEREQFLTHAGWSEVGTKGLQSITHMLVRLHMLDRFVDALSFPPNPTLRVMGKLPYPRTFPDSVDRVLS